MLHAFIFNQLNLNSLEGRPLHLIISETLNLWLLLYLPQFSQSWCPWVKNETCCNVVFQIVKHSTLIMENALLYLGSGLLRVEMLQFELSNWICLLVTVRLFACPWKWGKYNCALNVCVCVCYLPLLIYVFSISNLQKRKLDAVCYYMRSLAASNPILTAKESLMSLFEEAKRKVRYTFHGH